MLTVRPQWLCLHAFEHEAESANGGGYGCCLEGEVILTWFMNRGKARRLGKM